VAVITGGASGFGFAVAEQCAARGFDVALLDIDGERVARAASTLSSAHGVRFLGRRVDVASSADVDSAASELHEQLGRCDLLWANVGVQHFGAVETIADDVWRWILDVNVVGAARTVRSFLPLLRTSKPSRIAFTASASALAPAARLGAYQASKCALVGLAETLRIELEPESIHVSVVYPSGMLTRHLESSAAARPPALGVGEVSEDDLNAMMASRPMSAADLTTAEEAARRAVDGVLAAERHVITHGDLAGPVATHHAEIEQALARVTAPRSNEGGSGWTTSKRSSS
jgi:NAD(P)-dependent dehydrogenase (short-subunit alcohol dehydrogenase family)